MIENPQSCELLSNSRQTVYYTGLRYISDEQPGWARRRCGKGFSYYDEKGCIIRMTKS
jgi:hypothetical protein